MPETPTVNYMLYDHLGSTNITTDANGAVVSGLRYKACPLRFPAGVLREGEVRYPVNGTNPGPSKYTYTGQYSNVDDFGLMFYGARWYDSQLGRFTSADTVVPGNVQGLDRYAYVNNSPVNLIDPSGHCGIVYDDDGNATVGDLDCTAEDIDKWSIEYRQQWFDLLTQDYAGWFDNIEGILQAFKDTGTEMGGTWASVTDAGILETIQNGIAVAFKGVDIKSFGEQGTLRRDASEKWASFFSAFKSDKSDTKLKTLWGEAEAAGTTYGRDLAEGGMGLQPNKKELDFLKIGDFYRGVMGVKYGGEMLGGLVAGVPGWLAGGWATDPRSQIFGQAPVYILAVNILE